MHIVIKYSFTHHF